MKLGKLFQHRNQTVELFFRGSDAEFAAVLLNHVNAGATVRRVHHQIHRAIRFQHRAERAQSRIGIDEMVQHAGANDEVETAVQVAGVLDS
jgi:hypothetical protein